MENKDVIDCKFCGEEIKSTAKKCKHCGEFLEGNNNQGQPMINIVNQQTMNSDLSGLVIEKNWLVALLLSIFFGWLGVDRFYLGHGGSGIIKSELQVKKHIKNGGICGEEKLYKDVIKGIEISINLIQKNIDDRYILSK